MSKPNPEMAFQIGDIAKQVDGDRVFKVYGFSYGHDFIPDGWLVDRDGGVSNPKFYIKYEGATSALNEF